MVRGQQTRSPLSEPLHRFCRQLAKGLGVPLTEEFQSEVARSLSAQGLALLSDTEVSLLAQEAQALGRVDPGAVQSQTAQGWHPS